MSTTRLSLYGGTARPYGSFAGKEAQTGGPKPYTATWTRLSLFGGTALPYGDFVGKVPQTPEPEPEAPPPGAGGGFWLPTGPVIVPRRRKRRPHVVVSVGDIVSAEAVGRPAVSAVLAPEPVAGAQRFGSFGVRREPTAMQLMDEQLMLMN